MSAVEVCKALCTASRTAARAHNVHRLVPVLQPVPLTFSDAIMVMLVAMRMVVSSLSSMSESRCQARHVDPIDNGEVSMFHHKMDYPGVAASREQGTWWR
jgi:hypothetical protein